MSILKNFSSNSLFVSNAEANGFTGFTGLCTFLRRIFSGLSRRSVVGGALEHLGSLPLTAHSSLALVRLHKETLLLGITSHSITLLSKRNDEVRVVPNSIAADPVTLHEELHAQAEGPAR
jgi:flagellar biogenesis protein FliO